MPKVNYASTCNSMSTKSVQVIPNPSSLPPGCWFWHGREHAWLIEMDYEVYTRSYGDWLKPRLKRLAEGSP